MEKRKYHDLLGTNLLLENSDLNSSDEVSEFSGTSSSTKLTEDSCEEEQSASIYFSGLMVRTRKIIRLEERPGTSGAGGRGGSDIQGIESQSEMQTKGAKKGKKRRWDLVVTAARLMRENQKVRQGRKDEMERGWMKNLKE